MAVMKKHFLLSLGIIILLLIIDQAVKIWVKTSFHYSDPSIPLIGQWFRLNYVENQGMAFGATLGGGMWGKLLLSVFRVVAISFIGYYIYKRIRNGASKEFIIVASLVLAGAIGNLLDSMFYDFIFEFDACVPFNHLDGSGIVATCEIFGYVDEIEVRHQGFLFGNVVDMFQFYVSWPSWMPWLGGSQVFPAVWNVADAAISVGVIYVLFRQKHFFPKEA
jgi:signal peptidase II